MNPGQWDLSDGQFKMNRSSLGARFLLDICKTSCMVLLFYTTQEVYQKFGTVTQLLQKVCAHPYFYFFHAIVRLYMGQHTAPI